MGEQKNVNRFCRLTLINPTETHKHLEERQERPLISAFQSHIKIKRDFIYLLPHHEETYFPKQKLTFYSYIFNTCSCCTTVNFSPQNTH